MDMNILKSLKEASNMGYKKIATRAGLDVAVVWRLLNGRSPRPSAVVVEKLAEALGCETSLILKGVRQVTAQVEIVQEDDVFYVVVVSERQRGRRIFRSQFTPENEESQRVAREACVRWIEKRGYIYVE